MKFPLLAFLLTFSMFAQTSPGSWIDLKTGPVQCYSTCKSNGGADLISIEGAYQKKEELFLYRYTLSNRTKKPITINEFRIESPKKDAKLNTPKGWAVTEIADVFLWETKNHKPYSLPPGKILEFQFQSNLAPLEKLSGVEINGKKRSNKKVESFMVWRIIQAPSYTPLQEKDLNSEQILNGDFASGDLYGWKPFGVSSAGSMAYAEMSFSDSSLPISVLRSQIRPDNKNLDFLNRYQDGNMLQQTVLLKGDEKLSFEWDFGWAFAAGYEIESATMQSFLVVSSETNSTVTLLKPVASKKQLTSEEQALYEAGKGDVLLGWRKEFVPLNCKGSCTITLGIVGEPNSVGRMHLTNISVLRN